VPNLPSDETIEMLARAAGLELAWAAHREEVIAAARQAALQRAALQELDPTAEPWPPMQVPGAPREQDR
jgi:hypothetical protein